MDDRFVAPKAARKAARGFSNGLIPPGPLTKDEQRIWNDYVLKAPWLEQADALAAYAFARLFSRYLNKKADASMNLIGKLTTLSSKLGFTPVSRSRLGINVRRPRLHTAFVRPPADDDPAARFFDD